MVSNTKKEQVRNMSTQVSIPTLAKYMSSGFNILISGLHGTGKTMMLSAAVKSLGLRMHYLPASTLDPYIDIIGMPLPNKESGRLDFYRTDAIENAEVIFFDEMNRAETKTLNAMFEIIQFHTVAGTPLPNLKVVVAAINPVEAGVYDVDELDPALRDRFDIFMTAEPRIDMPYFKKRFGADITKKAKSFWTDYENARKVAISRKSKNPPAYVSPRRLDKILSAYVADKSLSSIADSIPPEASTTFSANMLFRELTSMDGNVSSERKPRVRKERKDTVASILSSSESLRTTKKRERVRKVLERDDVEDADKQKLISAAAAQLNMSVSPDTIFDNWMFLLERMTPNDFKIMVNGWYGSKKSRANSLAVSRGSQRVSDNMVSALKGLA